MIKYIEIYIMGNCSSGKEKEFTISKENTIFDSKNKDKLEKKKEKKEIIGQNKKKDETKGLDLENPAEKKKEKKEIDEIITDIQQNMEENKTRGLNLNYLDVFIDSIFPDDFPQEYKQLIQNEINEIKNIDVGKQNKINIFELKNIGNKQSFCFMCVVKKVSEMKCDIIYRYKMMDIKAQNIKKQLNENKDYLKRFEEVKQNIFNKLNEEIINS